MVSMALLFTLPQTIITHDSLGTVDLDTIDISVTFDSVSKVISNTLVSNSDIKLFRLLTTSLGNTRYGFHLQLD